ncbi:uncharacterized protein METZ01_LOCUS367273 [marine metagenome]|uniref:Uncharacterized protein n=1 Tax=marine metagenome TaxID=408172 RepID=A0A382SWX2_9ZZZZ
MLYVSKDPIISAQNYPITFPFGSLLNHPFASEPNVGKILR